ncbi:MAG: ABC transporter permease [Defluviitaleaceae bacterium]|nr:ABC transporter permease [Defluviitaleaceae bacterium]
MPILETISSAVASILANKMRAAFTMFGIVVGIASVMLITSVGDGFRNTINAQFEDMGLDEIQLFHTGAARPIEWHERMVMDDAEFLRNHQNLTAVTTLASTTFNNAVDILTSNDPRAVQLMGVDQYRQFFSGPTIIYGRPIMAPDVATGSNVIIIDEHFSMAAFGRSNSVGQTLNIRTPNAGTQAFTVIGIFEGSDAFALMEMFQMPFETEVPITTVQRLQGIGEVVGQIRVQVGYEYRPAIHGIGDNLIRIMEIRKNADDIFNAFSMASVLNEVDTIITIFTVFLTIVASISLMVGGIGVMNIMLVSVTERTREIGIRKSLGATNFNIVFQFLLEASILTAIGGAFGIVIGYAGGIGVGYLTYLILDLSLVPTVDIVTIAVIVAISASIGLLFGVYPARKASKLDPVESLRFE